MMPGLISLNSVIFGTKDLPRVRAFYERFLGLEVYIHCPPGGSPAQDCSDTHVNYKLGDLLLCFEDGEVTRGSSIVLNVQSLSVIRDRLANSNIEVIRDTEKFVIARDPDGREIIFDQIASGG